MNLEKPRTTNNKKKMKKTNTHKTQAQQKEKIPHTGDTGSLGVCG